jgi:hypothetical protein
VAAATPLSREEVDRVLVQLGPLTAERSVVLVGGQAVAYWVRILGVADRMPGFLPLTSKDIDFEGSARAARHAAALLGGSVRIAGLDDHTPTRGSSCSGTALAKSARSISSTPRSVSAPATSVTRLSDS